MSKLYCYLPAPESYSGGYVIPQALRPEFIGGGLFLSGAEADLRAYAAVTPTAILFDAPETEIDKIAERMREYGRAAAEHANRILGEAMTATAHSSARDKT